MKYLSNGSYLPGTAVTSDSITPGTQAASYPTIDIGRPIPYLQVLRSRAYILAGFAILGGGLAAMAVWKQPYIYQAHSFLEVQGINENILNTREVDPSAKIDNSSQSYINTEARLLQSGPLFDRVATDMNSGATAQPGQTTTRWTPPVTRREIAGGLRVRTHEGDRILELTMESRDPARAAAIVNSVATSFIRLDQESRWRSSKQTSQWLTSELGELADKLRRSEQELQTFTQGSNLLIDNEQGSVTQMRLRGVQDELARAQADRIAKESIFDNLGTAARQSQPVPLGDPTLDQYQIQLTGLQKQLAELEAVYAPDYYKIPPLKAQIASVERSLAEQRTSVLNRIESDYKAAQKREDLLLTQYASQFRQTADQTAKLVRFDALKKEVEMNRSIYEEMLHKVKGYGVASAMQSSNLRVVEGAEVPGFPSRPNKPLIVALSAFGGLFAGIFWVLARAVGNRNINEPGEAQQYLHCPELGVIPAAKADSRAVPISERLEHARLGSIDTASQKRNRKKHLETITWSCAPSLLAESFRSTSASLLLSKGTNQGSRVLLVTSLSPAEGKTTMASNLAIALAGAAGRVLLIDGDRYRARLHRIFDRQNERGLSELLQPAPVGKTISASDFVVDTPVPNLFLLPSGKITLPTPDLLYSDRMASLIAEFRKSYDVVLIDTPPMMHLPDARIIGRLSDGVILVLRAGRVRWESAVAAEQRLREDGIPVIGTVLNDWNPKKNGYGVYPNDKRVYSYFAGSTQ